MPNQGGRRRHLEGRPNALSGASQAHSSVDSSTTIRVIAATNQALFPQNKQMSLSLLIQPQAILELHRTLLSLLVR